MISPPTKVMPTVKRNIGVCVIDILKISSLPKNSKAIIKKG